MIQMLVLFCVLLALLLVSIKSSYKGMLLSPQLGVIAGFLLSVGYGLYWVDEYAIDLSNKTLFILIGGCSLFVFSCVLFQQSFAKFGLARSPKQRSAFLYKKVVYIASWKLLLFIIFQAIVLGWLLLFIVRLGNGGLSDAIYIFRHANTFTEDKIDLPKLLNLLRRLSMSSGYFWGYYLVYTFVRKGKTSKFLLASNLILSILNNIILGARTGAFIIIIGMVICCYYFIYIGKRRKIRIKTIAIGVFSFLILGFSFKFFGDLLGRGTGNFSFSEYLAIYLSAEIKNLDTFIRGSSGGGATLYTCQTMIYVVNWFSGRMGLPNWKHELDIPFYYFRGHNLGNVSTMFYAFYYDDGIRGVIIYTVLMALISSYVYVKATNECKNNKDRFSFYLVLYSYMYFCFLFSFFSNKFYEHIFNPSILWFFVTWLLLSFFSTKVKLLMSYRRGSETTRLYKA